MYTPIDLNEPEDDNQDDTPLSHFRPHVGSPSTSPRLPAHRLLNIGETLFQNMSQSDDEAYKIAESVGGQCSGFCQSYSMFQLVKKRYKENAKNPIVEPVIPQEDDDELDGDLEVNAEYVAYVIFQETKTTIKDCHAIAEAWKKSEYNDRTLEAAVAATLMLCPRKITQAAKTFGAYYQLLSSKTQYALEIHYAMNVGFILSLAGYKTSQPIIEDAPADNSRAARLIALNIDSDDVPAHFICPVSGQLMEQPICIGDGETWHTFEAAVIIHIAKEKQDDATCPLTRKLFSTLKFKPNAALDDEIEEWLDSKLRPERANTPSL